MTLEEARNKLAQQIDLGSGYNRGSARPILAEVQRVHGREAVDHLIKDLQQDKVFDFRPGTVFKW